LQVAGEFWCDRVVVFVDNFKPVNLSFRLPSGFIMLGLVGRDIKERFVSIMVINSGDILLCNALPVSILLVQP
jgi:hypothetical protein